MSAEKIATLEAKTAYMQDMMQELIKSSKETNDAINRLTNSLSENSAEQRHTREQLIRTHERIEKIETRTQTLEIISAEDRPWVSLIKSLNSKMWFTLVSVVGTLITSVGGMAYILSGAK